MRAGPQYHGSSFRDVHGFNGNFQVDLSNLNGAKVIFTRSVQNGWHLQPGGNLRQYFVDDLRKLLI